VKQLIYATIALALASGCTIRHYVAEDYPQYLINNQGESHLPTSPPSSYAIAPGTRSHSYEFRSGAAGYANLWIVQFGQMLDSSLQSRDVQAAFGRLTAGPEDPRSGLLVFDLQGYEFTDMGAHVALRVTHQRGGANMFTKVYVAGGSTQRGKVFWGGVFAMKNAVQQSTKQAIDDILRQLIADLNAQPQPQPQARADRRAVRSASPATTLR
jgi:hypothetical protein